MNGVTPSPNSSPTRVELNFDSVLLQSETPKSDQDLDIVQQIKDIAKQKFQEKTNREIILFPSKQFNQSYEKLKKIETDLSRDAQKIFNKAFSDLLYCMGGFYTVFQDKNRRMENLANPNPDNKVVKFYRGIKQTEEEQFKLFNQAYRKFYELNIERLERIEAGIQKSTLEHRLLIEFHSGNMSKWTNSYRGMSRLYGLKQRMSECKTSLQTRDNNIPTLEDQLIVKQENSETQQKKVIISNDDEQKAFDNTLKNVISISDKIVILHEEVRCYYAALKKSQGNLDLTLAMQSYLKHQTELTKIAKEIKELEPQKNIYVNMIEKCNGSNHTNMPSHLLDLEAEKIEVNTRWQQIISLQKEISRLLINRKKNLSFTKTFTVPLGYAKELKFGEVYDTTLEILNKMTIHAQTIVLSGSWYHLKEITEMRKSYQEDLSTYETMATDIPKFTVNTFDPYLAYLKLELIELTLNKTEINSSLQSLSDCLKNFSLEINRRINWFNKIDPPQYSSWLWPTSTITMAKKNEDKKEISDKEISDTDSDLIINAETEDKG